MRQVQIFVWDYSDPCHKFPTLYIDLFVDTYFLVRQMMPLMPSYKLKATRTKFILAKLNTLVGSYSFRFYRGWWSQPSHLSHIKYTLSHTSQQERTHAHVL